MLIIFQQFNLDLIFTCNLLFSFTIDLTGNTRPDTLLAEMQKDYVLKPLDIKVRKDPYKPYQSNMKNHVFEAQFRESDEEKTNLKGEKYTISADTEKASKKDPKFLKLKEMK